MKLLKPDQSGLKCNGVSRLSTLRPAIGFQIMFLARIEGAPLIKAYK